MSHIVVWKLPCTFYGCTGFRGGGGGGGGELEERYWDSNLATRLARTNWRFQLDVHDVYVPDQAFQPTPISFPP